MDAASSHAASSVVVILREKEKGEFSVVRKRRKKSHLFLRSLSFSALSLSLSLSQSLRLLLPYLALARQGLPRRSTARWRPRRRPRRGRRATLSVGWFLKEREGWGRSFLSSSRIELRNRKPNSLFLSLVPIVFFLSPSTPTAFLATSSTCVREEEGGEGATVFPWEASVADAISVERESKERVFFFHLFISFSSSRWCCFCIVLL